MKPEPLTFELCYRKQPMKFEDGKWVEDETAVVPDDPTTFYPMRGPHGKVAAEAHRLNEAQRRSRFMYYWFFPEVASHA